jgi:hypothetical protein
MIDNKLLQQPIKKVILEDGTEVNMGKDGNNDREYVCFIHNKTDDFDGTNIFCHVNNNTLSIVDNIYGEADNILKEYLKKECNLKCNTPDCPHINNCPIDRLKNGKIQEKTLHVSDKSIDWDDALSEPIKSFTTYNDIKIDLTKGNFIILVNPEGTQFKSGMNIEKKQGNHFLRALDIVKNNARNSILASIGLDFGSISKFKDIFSKDNFNIPYNDTDGATVTREEKKEDDKK